MPANFNLSNNLISNLKPASQRSLLGTIHIKILDLSCNKLFSFPSHDFFSSLSPFTLQKLILNQNRIGKLTEDLTKFCPHLSVLDLHQNDVDEVDRLAFRNAFYLQIIDLGSNQIETLSPGLFSNLHRLRIVNLSNNRLKNSGLPKDLFDGTIVETLNLSHNFLVTLPINSLSSISATLVNMDISFNQISYISTSLSYMPNLFSLNLAHNKLTLLSDNIFSFLPQLISLDLSYNTIRANFKELFHELQHVKELQLANIGLSTWPSFPLPNLISLNLSGNGLDVLEPNSNVVFRLDRLRTLDLSRNKFVNVPSFLWSSTPLLTSLEISYNPIRSISRESFSGLVKLQTLQMQPLPVLETIETDSFHSLFFLSHIKIQIWPGPNPLFQLINNLRGMIFLQF